MLSCDLFVIKYKITKEKKMTIETASTLNKDNKVSSPEEQVLSFHLKDQAYGVYIQNVKEIIKAPERISDYIDNPNVKGIISYRNGSLPIIDLINKIENYPTDNILDKSIIVIEKGEKLCGFLVEKVENIQQTTEKDITEVPRVIDDNASLGDKFVSKLLKRGDTIIPILDLQKMIG
ncbi:MAG: hypothetical protein CL760_01895 [Chloroflexi bacterium]|nr:hypothetical protein [Chloroflexota bacterium]|tara:strand:+ start:3189 stop:3719 length:531 start_codon:yes stop_codon:yes gene_type:complete